MVVFIGPNNSGQTTALQALALWAVGRRRWTEQRGGAAVPKPGPGATIKRRDLLAVPDANLLWRGLHVRDGRPVDGRPQTSNGRVEIEVEGVGPNGAWRYRLEVDYASRSPERLPVPVDAAAGEMALLPPMFGLASSEPRLDPGAVNVRLGEGRTAEVVRSL